MVQKRVRFSRKAILAFRRISPEEAKGLRKGMRNLFLLLHELLDEVLVVDLTVGILSA